MCWNVGGNPHRVRGWEQEQQSFSFSQALSCAGKTWKTDGWKAEVAALFGRRAAWVSGGFSCSIPVAKRWDVPEAQEQQLGRGMQWVHPLSWRPNP